MLSFPWAVPYLPVRCRHRVRPFLPPEACPSDGIFLRQAAGSRLCHPYSTVCHDVHPLMMEHISSDSSRIRLLSAWRCPAAGWSSGRPTCGRPTARGGNACCRAASCQGHGSCFRRTVCRTGRTARFSRPSTIVQNREMSFVLASPVVTRLSLNIITNCNALFHHEAVGADGREDVVHLRQRLYHPVAFQRARQVEEHGFPAGTLFRRAGCPHRPALARRCFGQWGIPCVPTCGNVHKRRTSGCRSFDECRFLVAQPGDAVLWLVAVYHGDVNPHHAGGCSWLQAR